jgi:hypothetical protein
MISEEVAIPANTGRTRMDLSVSGPPPTCFWTLGPGVQKTKHPAQSANFLLL